MKTWIGIDNGVTGSIGVITTNGSHFFETPIKKEQNYTKKKDNISRIDVVKLDELLCLYEHPFAVLERPFTNPKMWKTTISAIRTLEATISYLESMNIGFVYIDSKEWQRDLLPTGVKGSSALKKASHDIGIRMFPQHRELIEKHGDADGLLIAEYARRNY